VTTRLFDFGIFSWFSSVTSNLRWDSVLYFFNTKLLITCVASDMIITNNEYESTWKKVIGE
jgi:hypothetical protein